MSSPDYNYSIFKTIYPTKSIDGSYDNMGTMSVPSRTLLSHFGGCKYLFFLVFGRKETGAKIDTMATTLRV